MAEYKNNLHDNIPNFKAYNGNPLVKATNVSVDWNDDLIKEYLKCSEDPIYFISTYMKIVHVDRGLISFIPHDYQEEMIRSFHINRRTILATCRRAGKSTAVCGFILWYIIFNQDVNVALLANKGETAREMLGIIQLAYIHLPKWIQQGVTSYNRGNFDLENNSRVIASSSASDSLRGYRVNLLYIDECAYISNWEEFSQSVLPTVTSGTSTKILLCSTPNGLNFYAKLWKEAIDGLNGYNPIEVKWQRVPGNDEKWRLDTLQTLGNDQKKFDQEYNVEWLGSSGTLIDGWKLQELISIQPIQDKLGIKQYIAPEENHVYIMICDVSRGKGLDYSAFSIIDVTEMPYQQVCTFRSNITTPLDYANIIHNMAKVYHNAYVLVEINDIGEQVSTAVLFDFEYENIIYTVNNGRGGKTVSSGFGTQTSQDRGIRTTKAVKSVGCSILKLLIEQNQLIINDFDTIFELSRFSRKNASYEAETGSTDDLVMGLCLHRTTNVVTEDGNKSIKWIVDNKYIGKVLSINKNNNVEWNKITNHSSRRNIDKNWVQLRHSYGRNRKFLISTSDHECAYIEDIFDPKEIKYTAAKDMRDKYSIRNPVYGKENPLYNKDQVSVAIGILLGDGNISKKGKLTTAYGPKQKEYINHINHIISGTLSYSDRTVKRRGELFKQEIYTLAFPTNAQTRELRELLYPNKIKTIKNIINFIDEKALAFWYMDDGYYKMSKKCINPSVELCTDSFSYEDHILLQKHLQHRFNIKSSIVSLKENKWRKTQQYRLRIGTVSSKTFFSLVAPYFCDIMKYKLPEEYRNVTSYNFNNTFLEFAILKIIEVKNIPNNRKYQSKLYDIEVENTHNFFAEDTLVHNCLFGWLSDQSYFRELSDINTLMKLRDQTDAQMEEHMLPFGFTSEFENLTMEERADRIAAEGEWQTYESMKNLYSFD